MPEDLPANGTGRFTIRVSHMQRQHTDTGGTLFPNTIHLQSAFPIWVKTTNVSTIYKYSVFHTQTERGVFHITNSYRLDSFTLPNHKLSKIKPGGVHVTFSAEKWKLHKRVALINLPFVSLRVSFQFIMRVYNMLLHPT